MPSVLQYTTALESLAEAGLDPKKREMLRAQYAAPGHITTHTLLARHVGYSDYGAANLHYGTLGRMIAQEGDFAIPIPDFKLSALATWGVDAPDGSGCFAFKMRPQLVEAIRRLGWHRRAVAPQEPAAPDGYLEGKQRKAFVAVKHREARARLAKIAAALAMSPDGRLICEVPRCGFDFEAVYGERGHGFAEVHHTNPLATRTRDQLTRLEDLVVICANCHAMVHRFGDALDLDRVIPRKRRS